MKNSQSCLQFLFHEMFCVCRVSPRRRGPFVPAKGPKTIDAPFGLIGAEDASLRRADQLAPLKQGPPGQESVPPLGQTVGVSAEEQEKGVSWEGDARSRKNHILLIRLHTSGGFSRTEIGRIQ